MDVPCDHCGESWTTSEKDASSETRCRSCRLASPARKVSMPSAARDEFLVDREKVLSLLELQGRVFQKRANPPDATRAASLASLEREVLARSAPPAALATPSPPAAAVDAGATPPPAMVAAVPPPLPAAEVAAEGAQDRVTLPAPPVPMSLLEHDHEEEQPTQPGVSPEELMAALSLEARAEPTRSKATVMHPSRGAWTPLDLMFEDFEEIFDQPESANERELGDAIPLVPRRSLPPVSSRRSFVDPGSLSPFAVEDIGSLRAPPARPLAPTSVPLSRNLVSGLQSAALVAAFAAVYVGLLHDRPPVASAAGFARPESNVQASAPLVARGLESEAAGPIVIDPPIEMGPPELPPPPPVQTKKALATAPSRHAGTVLPSPPVLDSETLTRAGDQALRQADYTRALEIYERVVSANPRYLPARLSVADIQWAAGDHTAARDSYERILEEFPSDLVPERARARSRARGASSASVR